jgi:hypothetical protein
MSDYDESYSFDTNKLGAISNRPLQTGFGLVDSINNGIDRATEDIVDGQQSYSSSSSSDPGETSLVRDLEIDADVTYQY